MVVDSMDYLTMAPSTVEISTCSPLLDDRIWICEETVSSRPSTGVDYFETPIFPDDCTSIRCFFTTPLLTPKQCAKRCLHGRYIHRRWV